MNLWAVSVTAASPVVVTVPDDLDLLITRAALASTATGPNILSYEAEKETEGAVPKIVLGTLRYDKVEQFELDICASASSTLRFFLKGTGEVHLSGYYNAIVGLSGDSDFDSDDGYLFESDSDVDEDFLSRTKSPSESIDSDADHVLEEVIDVPQILSTSRKAASKPQQNAAHGKKETTGKKEAAPKVAQPRAEKKVAAPKAAQPKVATEKTAGAPKAAAEKTAGKKSARPAAQPKAAENKEAATSQKRKPEAAVQSASAKKAKTGPNMCNFCEPARSFASDVALLSHTVAKHSQNLK